MGQRCPAERALELRLCRRIPPSIAARYLSGGRRPPVYRTEENDLWVEIQKSGLWERVQSSIESDYTAIAKGNGFEDVTAVGENFGTFIDQATYHFFNFLRAEGLLPKKTR